MLRRIQCWAMGISVLPLSGVAVSEVDPDWEEALRLWRKLAIAKNRNTQEIEYLFLCQARVLLQLGRPEEARRMVHRVRSPAMKATKRYRASSSRNSAFNGLHNFSGNHGVGISNNNLHYNKAKTYAQYLRAGMDFREAWQDVSLDTANWTNNYEKGCYIIPNPSTGCGMSGTAFDCSRWWAYPSTFYIKEQRNETIYNRDSYADDYQYGDSGYDVDLTYTYQSESVPISATGYSLP